MPVYQPREGNVIQKILHDHFPALEDSYEDKYSEKYCKYRIIRIKESVERFIECGAYSKGVARIKCTYAIVTDFYNKVTQKPIKTGAIISHQTFGDVLRFNPHEEYLPAHRDVQKESDNTFYRKRSVAKDALRRIHAKQTPW